MGYYPNTIARVKFLVGQEYPGVEPTADIADKPAYILWMLEQIKEMKGDPTKAARWIGYAVRMAEELDLLTNAQSRDLCRMDVQEGAI